MKMKKTIFTYLVLMFCSASGIAQVIKSQQECEYNGDIRSSNITMPAEMYPDQKTSVKFRIGNTGTCIWKAGDVFLKVSIKRGPNGAKVQRDELLPGYDGTIQVPATNPDTYANVEYDIEAPYYLGEYTMEYELLFKSSRFGNSATKVLKIVPKK